MGNTMMFENAIYTSKHPSLPYFLEQIELDNHTNLHIEFVDAEYEQFKPVDFNPNDFFPEKIVFNTEIVMTRKKPYAKIFFIPLRKNPNGIFERLKFFTLKITPKDSKKRKNSTRRTQTFNSVLSDGDIFKIAVSENAIYKLDYQFFNSVLNINPRDIDPRNIQIYGNGGGRLPEFSGTPRIDDLEENTLYFEGQNDGSFDPEDFILFYGQSPDKIIYKPTQQRFECEQNIYEDHSYYFIKIGTETGKRIETKSSLSTASYLSTTFDDFIKHENDKINLLHNYEYASGSGKIWLGEHFDAVRSYDFNNFNFPNIEEGSEVKIKVGMALRKNGRATFSNFNVNAENFTFKSNNVRGVDVFDIDGVYANYGLAEGVFAATDDNIALSVTYNEAGAEGWLDYIEVNARRRLVYEGNPLFFRDMRTLTESSATFLVSNVSNQLLIWNISNPLHPFDQSYVINDNEATFSTEINSTLQTFVAFGKNNNFPEPDFVQKIEHQNLHEIDDTDMIIIYHKTFETAAMQLQEHRQNHSGLNVRIVEINQVFNEFSSGSQDPTAIRDFVKMVYDRTSNFKYLLLIGDGSFDYKNIYNRPNNNNYIPIYETANSFDPIFSFPSDDYYGLLSDNEGDDLRGGLDIAIGRLTVRTPVEAEQVVRKIIYYETSPNTLGDWRNRLTFVADDEDSNLHLNQEERIATRVDTVHKAFNLEKIYFDAFPQAASAGGSGYPLVTQALNNSIFKGHLVMNYLGHGGPQGWAQERVLGETDIAGWQNIDNLPLFITATCSFAAYDDPDFLSAGEQLLLKGDGGAIGLYSTVRAVFSSSNERLTRATFEQIFKKVDGEYATIGEILRLAKNSNSADTLQPNARKYLLLGDPALKLALPKYDIRTTSINGNIINGLDTLSALQEVTIEGMITDNSGILISDFNGTVFPTIYDKPVKTTTLANDSGSFQKDFLSQKSIIFKGAATVNNGLFKFTFVVPKDINYTFGKGKISYYAHDAQARDATGYYEDIIVGGTSPNIFQDDSGPLVEVYMNDDKFVSGGITNKDPILYIKIEDNIGINVVGTSIGHDLTAVLDDEDSSPFVLNDFYEAAVDDHRKGEVNYPLFNLDAGYHEVVVRAWDVSNNVGEGSTAFIVADDAQIALKHVLNYPNPFINKTAFQFEHNFPNQQLNIQIQILTVSGKIVKTIQEEITTDGFRVTGIMWDGLDDYGDKLGRGVYLYKVGIKAIQNDGTFSNTESRFEKLVILK